VSVLSRARRRPGKAEQVELASGAVCPPPADSVVRIAEVEWRKRARVAGRVRSMRIQPWAGVPTLECTLVDATGGVAVVFLGRRQVAGIHPGTCLVVEGMVGEHNGRLAILNPEYDFVTL
jgi:hypothetical protein